MSIEKLTKRLQGSIDFALDNEEDLDAASWNYQEGILITVNEAKLLLDLVKNCSIPAVVGRSEQLLAVAEYVYNHFDDSSSKTAKDYLQDFLSQ